MSTKSFTFQNEKQGIIGREGKAKTVRNDSTRSSGVSRAKNGSDSEKRGKK